MLCDLIIAMESDVANNKSLVDIGWVSGFMQMVGFAFDNIGLVTFLLFFLGHVFSISGLMSRLFVLSM